MDDGSAVYTPSIEAVNLLVHQESQDDGLPPLEEPSRARIVYSDEIHDMLGEANGLYVSQRFDEAIKVLLIVIKEEARLPQAFETLGLCFEALGRTEQALNVFLVAAHLYRSDPDAWKRVAGLASAQKDWKKAIYCYTKLTRSATDSFWALSKRAEVYRTLRDYPKAIRDYNSLLSKHPYHVGVVGQISLLYLHLGMDSKAITLLNGFFNQPPPTWDLSLAQLLIKFYIEASQYEKALGFIETTKTHVGDLPLDMVVQAAICHLYLGDIDLAEHLLNELYDNSDDLQSVSELYLEVCDGYIAGGMFEKALYPLEILVADSSTSTHEVWSRLATCYFETESFELSLDFARRAVDANPGDISYRLTLSTVYQAIGNSDLALEVLQESHYQEQGLGFSPDVAQFDSLLLSRGKPPKLEHSPSPRKRYRSRGPKKRVSVFSSEKLSLLLQMAEIQLSQGETLEFVGSVYTDISTELEDMPDHAPEILYNLDFLELSLSLVKALAHLKRCSEAKDIIDTILETRYDFTENRPREEVKAYHRDFKSVYISVCFQLEDFQPAMRVIQQMLIEEPKNHSLLLNLGALLNKTNYPSRFKRVLERFFEKNPNSVSAVLMVGHFNMMKCAFTAALKKYVKALELDNSDPAVLLCFSIASLLKATSVFIEDRHRLVLQAFSTLYQLLRHRSESNDKDIRSRGISEALYNLGVAFQLLALNHQAVAMYKHVLSLDNGLTRAASWNLQLIYRSSGNEELARRLVQMYHTI